MLTLGSLFDGIGGWLLAAKHAGVTPVWASEIDDFPAAVTAYHFPDVNQLGDITKIDALEPVDIICAGSPCQDLSVAGKREGLAGERSGLFRTAIKLVHRLRARTGKPRFFVWENVPGAFSSNKRQDFRAVLEEIGQAAIPMPRSGRWADAGLVRTAACDIAWRVLDAQYWGVPQRRKRIFLVADFAAANRCAGEILFECESVRGDSAESEGAREGAATVAGDGAEVSSWCTVSDIINRKDENGGHHLGVDKQREVPLYDISHRNDGVREMPRGVVNTLTARMGTGGGNVAVLNETDRQEIDGVRTVRRLTVTECERLQGLPDGYTYVEFKGKPAPDSRRYKALGNGMAQPCADFVIRRIVENGKKGIDNTPPDVV